MEFQETERRKIWTNRKLENVHIKIMALMETIKKGIGNALLDKGHLIYNAMPINKAARPRVACLIK